MSGLYDVLCSLKHGSVVLVKFDGDDEMRQFSHNFDEEYFGVKFVFTDVWDYYNLYYDYEVEFWAYDNDNAKNLIGATARQKLYDEPLWKGVVRFSNDYELDGHGDGIKYVTKHGIRWGV